MANQEQLEILKQGVDVWNTQRENNEIDLSYADLRGFDLNRVYLWKTDLHGANLRRANLREGQFRESNLSGANLSEVNLSGANLSFTNLRSANLNGANLNGVDLRFADLRSTNLDGVNFSEAVIFDTVFESVDLSKVYGLEQMLHEAPSLISTDTIRLSNGKIPVAFLRGCGLSDWEIESAKLYNPDLTNEEIIKIQYRIYDLRATQALQISPLFISYSHGDKPFVDKIDTALTQKGVRFWRDIHNAIAGRLETQIDHAIRQNPTMLLVLSKNSINSDWVQHEVRTARELEKELGRDALCPIALDDSWKNSSWPKRVMEQVMEYNILDFSKWENEFAFDEKFAKLLNGLDLFYKKPEK